MQCLGLAEALDQAMRAEGDAGLSISVKRAQPKPPYAWLPYPLTDRVQVNPQTGARGDALAPPWPDIVVACGRKAIPLALGIKRAGGGAPFLIQTQDPKISPGRFDLVVAPEHDGLTGHNVLSLLGSPNRVTPAKIEQGRSAFASLFGDTPRPMVSVLLGGNSGAFRMTPAHVAGLAARLARIIEAGGSVAITPSRRTPPDCLAHLRSVLEPLGAYIWDGQDPNPYFGVLAHADHLVVSADSANMLTEAAATGKPVHVLGLDGGNAKFTRLHQSLQARGATRPFDVAGEGDLPTWRYEALLETPRVAAAALAAYRAYRAS